MHTAPKLAGLSRTQSLRRHGSGTPASNNGWGQGSSSSHVSLQREVHPSLSSVFPSSHFSKGLSTFLFPHSLHSSPRWAGSRQQCSSSEPPHGCGCSSSVSNLQIPCSSHAALS